MLGKKLQAIALFAIAFIAGALVFAFAPSRLYAQTHTVQWVPFTVGQVSGQNAAQVAIYTTNGTFMVSDIPGDDTTIVRERDGTHWTRSSVFGRSTETADGNAQVWEGHLVPGTYYVGVNGDVSALSISGEAVSYTPSTQSAPVMPRAPAPVAQPNTAPANAGQPAANPSGQTQWFIITVGQVKNQDAAQVNIHMTNGTFMVSDSPSDQTIVVRERNGTHWTETSVFGRSSENAEGNAQIWEGHLVPGAYYVGVNGDASTLSIWGEAVTYAPLSSSGQ